nr:hypothetical protein [uncultured Flavobacterium sp.]
MEKTNLEIAKELGINNPESLTAAQLKKAIADVNEKNKAFELLKEKAKEIGIVFSEDIAFEDLAAEVEAAEEAIEDQKKVGLFNEKAHIVIDATVGFDSFNSSSPEELLEALVNFYKKTQVLIDATVGDESFGSLSSEELLSLLQSKSSIVTTEELEIVSGKTDETISLNGIDYQFSEKAPESFKFMGVIRTQKEWITDSDAMELMISGNLSYVKPLKK